MSNCDHSSLPPLSKRPRMLHCPSSEQDTCNDENSHFCQEVQLPADAADCCVSRPVEKSLELWSKSNSSVSSACLDDSTVSNIAYASTIEQYLAPGGLVTYLPQQAWTCVHPGKEQTSSNTNGKPYFTKFGRDQDSALLVAIRSNATDAALVLMKQIPLNSVDALVFLEYANNKGVTPLILAAQRGNDRILRQLLKCDVNMTATSINGSSALLQAAHFGQIECLQILLQCASGKLLAEMPNNNGTTPLMRAAQEGHVEIVRVLLQQVKINPNHINQQNAANMSALMLAAQRGHVEVCRMLIQARALVNLHTAQKCTALVLACKRGHVDVVKLLVAAGCALCIQDTRGRSARDIVLRRCRSNNFSDNNERETNADTTKCLLEVLDTSVQVDLMQRLSSSVRNMEMTRMWYLFQTGRATVGGCEDINEPTISIHNMHIPLDGQQISAFHQEGSLALIRTMTLPLPLVKTISQFLPLPKLWDTRLHMLVTFTSFVDPNSAATSALDLIDEVLEDGGFLEACDAAQVPIPFHKYKCWCQWKHQRGGCIRAGEILMTMPNGLIPQERSNACTDRINAAGHAPPTFLQLRHQAGYLKLLDQHKAQLCPELQDRGMSSNIIEKLVTVSDLASCLRRIRKGLSLDAPRALDVVMLASQLCSWYWREHR